MKRFAIVLLFVACASVPQQSPRVTVDAFLEALNTGDANVAKLFTEDATVFFPMNDRSLRANGREEIAKVFAALFAMPNYRGGTIVPEALQVQLLGDAAVVTFQLTSPNVTSRRTFVLRRESSGWKIVHLHGSNIRS